jgi:hypothetical protein
MFNEDPTCIKKLLAPAERVISQENSIKKYPFDRRVALWNEIQQNYDRFIDGDCGKFYGNLDNLFHGKFSIAQLILAIMFREQGEKFEPAEIFSDLEVDAYHKVAKYGAFEIYSPQDIRKKLDLHDTKVLTLLSDYYYHMDTWIGDTVENSSMNPWVRFYLRFRWEKYRSHIDKAVKQDLDRWMHIISEYHDQNARKAHSEMIAVRRELEETDQKLRVATSASEQLNREIVQKDEHLRETRIALDEKERLIDVHKSEMAIKEKQIQEILQEDSRRKDELSRQIDKLTLSQQNLVEEKQRVQQEKIMLGKEKAGHEQKEHALAKKEREIREIDTRLQDETRELEIIRGKLRKTETGGRYVCTVEARQYEMTFIGRIERRLGKKGASVSLLDKPYLIREISEDAGFQRSDLDPALKDRISDRDLQTLPENRYLAAGLQEIKLFGERQEYTFRALFLSRPGEYARFGFDTESISLKEVLPVLDHANHEARSDEIPVFLCIGSPTGFTRELQEFTNGEKFHRNFLSRHLSVCFLDLETGRLFYNPHDHMARAFVPYCEMEIDEEKMEHVLRISYCNLDEQFRNQGHAEYDALLRKCRDEGIADETLVKNAFHRYGEENVRRVKHGGSIGLVMLK